MTRILTTFSIILTVLFLSCGRTKDLTEDEIYTILNDIISDDSLRLTNVKGKFTELQWNSDYEKYFTKDDIIFSSEQDKIFSNLTIKPEKLKRWRWKQVQKRGHSPYITVNDTTVGCVSELSFPLISIDRKTVLIQFTEDCGGMFGYSTRKCLFKKENGRWTIKQWFDVIVS